MSAEGHSRLGFGCAHLPGRLGRPGGIALVETALDHGIRHFDVARMYGDGAAEDVVGDVAKRRRHEMFIFTKAGIAPAPRALPARAFRRAIATAPLLGKAIPEALRAALAPRFSQFAPAQIRASIETSLRELRTDHVDALLLHECEPAHITDDLKRELERLKAEGKALSIGIATSAAAANTIITESPEICAVVQVRADSEVTPPKCARLIVHSVLATDLPTLIARFERDLDFARRFTQEVGVDARDQAALARMLMQRALDRRPDATLLFSSHKAEHIRANATLANAAPAPAALERFLAEAA